MTYLNNERKVQLEPCRKKRKKNIYSNYSPVNLTSVICTLLESPLRDVLLKYLESNNKIVSHQYGFRPGYSCATQLLNVCEDFSTYMELHCDFDYIYLDFDKAFDRVSHQKLIYKISDIGIQGNFYFYYGLQIFLSHRRQRVMCNGVCSNWSEVTSGMPKGSVLGPLLFTIFINDLPLSITSHIQIFPDDTKIYNTVQDSGILKNDLNKLVLWSKEWLLSFNTEKCNILHFGKTTPILNIIWMKNLFLQVGQ